MGSWQLEQLKLLSGISQPSFDQIDLMPRDLCVFFEFVSHMLQEWW